MSPRLLPTASLKPEDLAGLRVLVIDDNMNTLRMVSDVLRAAGVGQVFIAQDGVRGIEAMAARHPHIIFCDREMPAMDGLQFTRFVRGASLSPDERVPDPRVPIIMLTGQRSERDVEQARKAGVNEFVAKPFTPAGLLSRIELVLLKPREFIISEVYVGPDRRRRTELAYTGPMRRISDPELIVDEVERKVTRGTISVELEALRNVIIARGGVDRATLQMTYRVMQHAEHRARQVRDQMVERASASMRLYTEAMGGPDKAEAEVLDLHMDALRTLLSLDDTDVSGAGVVVRELEQAVKRKIAMKEALERAA
ncbi:MAG: response regulator [Caulobacteraceae bacterium]